MKPPRVFCAFRLLPETKERITQLATVRGCSEAKVIDAWANRDNSPVYIVADCNTKATPKALRKFVNSVIIEGKTINGGVGRVPTTPKPKIRMVAQQPARQPILKPGATHL